MDIKLNKETHDLDITDGSPTLVTGRDAIHQHLKIRLLWGKGEWFLNTDLGIPYLDRIFIRGVNEADVISIFADTAKNTPGILSVDNIILNTDFATRIASLTMLLTDINGPVNFATEVPIP